MDFSDPDWVAAVGQVAGAAASAVAVIVALAIAGRDRRQRDQDRIAEAVGRAAMVFARDDGGNVVVTNHSDRPVRAVYVRVGHPSELRLQWTPNNVTGQVADILPAGTTASLRSSYGLTSASGDTFYPLNSAPKDSWIVLGFADIEGRPWVRVGEALPTWQREPRPAWWRKFRFRQPSWRWPSWLRLRRRAPVESQAD